MRLVNLFTHYVSGSDKHFERYSGCKVTSITTYYTKYDKHMMEVVLDGKVFLGKYCEEIFKDIQENLGVPRDFLFHRNSRNQLMIACVPKVWCFMEYA